MTIAFTIGEPAGIGPDLAILNAKLYPNPDLVTFADPDILKKRATELGINLIILENKPAQKRGQINVYPITAAKTVTAGKLDAANVPFVLKMLDSAISHCLNNKAQVLLTAPVHKGIINQAGVKFSGHTEYLGVKTHKKTVMLLANNKLKLALVSTHLSLKEVPKYISRYKLIQVIKILHSSLNAYFNINNPKIAICGLNPHAGENGYLGSEEITIINPVIQQLKQRGLNLIGAISADTAFTANNLQKYDAILAMYHDQGLPALKALDFENSINITLGLPFLRVSVDHGTALNLAATANISLASLLAAIKFIKAQINKNPLC